MRHEIPTFDTEAALCQAFALSVPDEWIIYPETGGWDLLLVHRQGGWQIGVEAKLSLNAKVLAQSIKSRKLWQESGPDFRAVLVGKVVAENATLARALGLTVISPRPWPVSDRYEGWYKRYAQHGPRLPRFVPELPEASVFVRLVDHWSRFDMDGDWIDQFPTKRIPLPDYVPEVAAGVPSPLILSQWKIKAMRVCVWVERKGSITRAVFRDLGIDPSRWMNGVWLRSGEARGEWIAGPRFPADQLRREHPTIFPKVEADFDQWSQRVGVKA